MPLDENNGTSSTPEHLDAAQDAALAANDFARYSEVENARDQNKPLPEASAPSKEPSDQTPAPEPGTAKEIQEKPKPKTGEDRKVELAAEIKELLRQRAELKTEPVVKVAEPAPAAVVQQAEAPKPAAAGDAPVKPKLDDFPTFEEFDIAKDAWTQAMIVHGIAKAETARGEADAQAKRNKTWEDRKIAAREEFDDFDQVAFQKETPISTVMEAFMKRSDQEARILYKLGENGGAEGKRISAMPDAFDQVEAMSELKRSLAGGAAPIKKEIPPVKKHTAAPAPATNLGGNTGEPADAAEAALAAHDFTNYMAKENARELKAAR
jgi:hypothetical protein